MKIGELYRFEDFEHFKGFVRFDDLSISYLESKIKCIRASFEIVKRHNAGEQK
jgi:hypothetical protein